MKSFTAKIFKVGVNPCVVVPDEVLKYLFREAGKDKGPIPVQGKLNGASFIQTVVKFRGDWRLYVNGKMMKAAGVSNGDQVKAQIRFDNAPRDLKMNQILSNALFRHPTARQAFENLPPYRRKEIIRYMDHLRSEVSVKRNIEKILLHLSGKGTFAGRK